MPGSFESRRFTTALASLQAQLLAARNDVALLEKLASPLSRLATDVSAACERAFIAALEVPAA